LSGRNKKQQLQHAVQDHVCGNSLRVNRPEEQQLRRASVSVLRADNGPVTLRA